MTIPTPPRAPMAAAASASDAQTSAAASVPSRRSRGWWRRNLIALLVLAVVAPALGGYVWWDGWYAAYGHGARPTTPVAPGENGTVTMAGTTFGPIESGIAVDTEGFDLPAGTSFHIATVGVDPQEFVDPGAETPVMVSCASPVLVQQSTGRRWTPLRTELGIPYSSEEPDSCETLAEEPYQLVVGFVVPDDVEGPFWLDVDPAGDGSFIRFPIDP
ncbi:hypothetical protein ACFWHT_11595 [Microbacterium sp. NPDC058342]|uniref:hypothetical protein n=1 Tax=Microbacterium sp. NPDC058342 TaxID=3346454 RepID=UPI0036482DC5